MNWGLFPVDGKRSLLQNVQYVVKLICDPETEMDAFHHDMTNLQWEEINVCGKTHIGPDLQPTGVKVMATYAMETKSGDILVDGIVQLTYQKGVWIMMGTHGKLMLSEDNQALKGRRTRWSEKP